MSSLPPLSRLPLSWRRHRHLWRPAAVILPGIARVRGPLTGLLVFLLLAACGGSGAPPASSPGPVSPYAPADGGEAHPRGVHPMGEGGGMGWGRAEGRSTAVCFPVEGLPARERAMADSLLARGLDNEALYTALSDAPGALPLKPISTLDQRRGELARDPDAPEGIRDAVDPERGALADLADLHRVAARLHCGPLRVLVVPFRATQDRTRSLQVLLVHQGALDWTLERDSGFWGQWGLQPGAEPGVVVTVVEFEAPGPRFRGYGYLFGYPEHAVTFFVEAAAHTARTGEFVARDFFQLPVHSGQTGRFVYAVPEGHAPLSEDTALLEAAEQTLVRYRELRPAFENPDGTLRAVELLRFWMGALEDDPG